jgi:hypothetical protein
MVLAADVTSRHILASRETPATRAQAIKSPCLSLRRRAALRRGLIVGGATDAALSSSREIVGPSQIRCRSFDCSG